MQQQEEQGIGWPDRATLLLYVIFGACGVGLVLPGTLLPQLLARWSLNDGQAGGLLFLFFVGSTAGALLARGRLSRAIAVGCVLTGAGSAALGMASRAASAVAVMLLGLGLGITMTAVSLVRSRCRRASMTAEMARLNLIWALGASVTPSLLLRSCAAWPLSRVLACVAAGFVLLGVAAAALVPDTAAASATATRDGAGSQRGWRPALQGVPWLLLAMVTLATGVESSAGGWLAAYARRSGLLLNGTISTVTCFWGGLLVSRFAQSHRRLALTSGRVALRSAPWLAAVALLLLLLPQGGATMSAAAFALGVGVGPMYPLTLSLLLQRGEAGNVAFVAGGVGSSALPLLTGLVSGYAGSLSAGLLVPLAAAAGMGVLALLVARSQAPGSSRARRS